MNNKKLIEIVAGHNGSGKTTFAESYLVGLMRTPVFLNPDLIAAGFSRLDFEKASFQAGRVLIHEVKVRIQRSESFAFESTLSGKNWLVHLQDAVAAGYSLKIYFLFLNRLEKNLARIKRRVQEGGHDIPVESVVRRHPRCFSNFWNLYRPMAEEWHIFDNSNSKPKLVLSKEAHDAMSKADQIKFQKQFLQGMRNG